MFIRSAQESKDKYTKLIGASIIKRTSANQPNFKGNDNIHKITSIGDYELRIDLQDWQGQTWYAVYKSFRVGDESTKYTLSLGSYTGTAGDSLSYQNGMKFSTYDQDNDAYNGVDCVARDHAGWWYNMCHNVNINGLYKKGKSNKHNVVSWNSARGPYYSLKFVRMMIRRH
ncbi:Fibrinogen-like protein 1,Fibrinogen-like protein A,Tenascin,Ryncolin-4,Angiopoietin-related protein 1,Ficolin-2,Tenascin-R,Ficolin-1 [Mytilus coruscus]|uniref:Fibrinogen-like protein 1,Fibrinogen-like protein A,Tenascin,Ryncolin-4,Angiopoietin-related protein 1,Ficolin-2,Tenascin-R,Ficolin-1 n=1 Tax=Mytilus coruscus TaxID=42192 RepID=A0A6J8CK08_MYTCO|nr:Fibrinogen-like protein 1,Fibrinogen-like protein A,Tenascin,Ryncolin-4,Angiopoietin-related protein 1,Ficolin-2,Tenascin-R,Ficolin-1 [Mytilus coruscus]